MVRHAGADASISGWAPDEDDEDDDALPPMSMPTWPPVGPSGDCPPLADDEGPASALPELPLVPAMPLGPLPGLAPSPSLLPHARTTSDGAHEMATTMLRRRVRMKTSKHAGPLLRASLRAVP